jgi:large subunit ribosomal protein L22
MAEEKDKGPEKGKEQDAPAKRGAKPSAKPASSKKPAAEKGAGKAAPAKGAKKPAAEGKGAKKPAAEGKGAKKPAAEGKAPAKAQKPVAEPEEPVVRARARYMRVSPRKARLVANQIRGMDVTEAKSLLQFSPRGAARDLERLLDSAMANAEANHDLIGEEMRISDIRVDEGPTLRRYRPRALGRATRINKRTSHISVALSPLED